MDGRAGPRDPFALGGRGIVDARVLAAMAAVPRERFVPEALRGEARADRPLPIGHGQTISQPFIVAWMTQALGLEPHHRVLEIGTGCGYQTAILAEIATKVVSLEVVPELSAAARETLDALGYGGRIELHVANGFDGWPPGAPYDRILLTAAPPELPPTLVDQLADGGRMIAPVGTDAQAIEIVTRQGDRIDREPSIPVRFVPMVRR